MKNFRVNYTVTAVVEVEKIIKSKSKKDLEKLLENNYELDSFKPSEIEFQSVEDYEINEISED